MDWFTDRHFFLLAVAIYGLSMVYSVFLWRKGFREDNRINYLLLFIAFGLHTTAMVKRGFSLNHCPVTNLYEATTFAAWTLVAMYLAVGVWSRLRFLGAFASPVLFGIGVFALMPSLDAAHGSGPEVTSVWTSLHAALMSLAYGAFGLSSVAALMYLTQEHNLKFHKLQAIFSRLPPIQRLEAIVGRLLLAGFILLTIGLAIGAYDLARIGDSQSHRGDPKIVWSGLVWLLYLGLLVMRWKFSQGGRRFALGAIGSFVFVLLTFWGSNLLSPLHNPRAPTGPKDPTQASISADFLFFGGANMEQRHQLQCGQLMNLSHDITLVAPPKSKKKKIVVWSLAINRPPLRGLGTCARSPTYPGLSKMWVMTSIETLGYCRASLRDEEPMFQPI